MPNIAKAKEEIRAAAGLLVNRFGHEAEVFARLNAALIALKEDDPPAAVVTEAETASTDDAVIVDPEAEPPPPSASLKRRTKR